MTEIGIRNAGSVITIICNVQYMTIITITIYNDNSNMVIILILIFKLILILSNTINVIVFSKIK